MERPALAEIEMVRRAAGLRHYRGLLSTIAEPHNHHSWIGRTGRENKYNACGHGHPQETASGRLGSPGHRRDPGIHRRQHPAGDRADGQEDPQAGPRRDPRLLRGGPVRIRAPASTGEARLRGEGHRSVAGLAKARGSGQDGSTGRQEAAESVHCRTTDGGLCPRSGPGGGPGADPLPGKRPDGPQACPPESQQSADPSWVYLPGRELLDRQTRPVAPGPGVRSAEASHGLR